MNKRINFEDTIFILMIQIRVIRDMLNLDADPELFLEKIMYDLDFIDKILAKLMASLAENHKLIERDEVIRNLGDLEWNFYQVVQDFFPRLAGLKTSSLEEGLRFLMDHSRERNRQLESLGSLSENREGDPVVSRDELNELLKDFEEK